VSVRFAPFNQVFQELLAPRSAMASHRDGVNVALLRLADWAGADGSGDDGDVGDGDDVGDEFVRVLTAFQRGRETPFIVVFCPDPAWAADPAAGAAGRRARITAGLAGVPGVVCLDMAAMLERYGVVEYRDDVSDEAGRVPYTPEFFAALGTCLARQVSALVTAYPSVVLVNGDHLQVGVDEPTRRLMSGALAGLAAQGRPVYLREPEGPAVAPDSLAGSGITLVGGRSAVAALDEAARAAGVTPGDCLFLSADGAACAAMRTARPDVLVLQRPSDGAGLSEFLEHTWLLDPGGAATPPPAWWRVAARGSG
jgi:hypothetical protein